MRAGKVSFAVVNVACALHLTFDYVGTISATIGPSMLPTIADHGDFVLEDRISVLLNPTTFVRGELITFKSPQDPTKIVCKRIIGLPGDTVCVDPSGRQAPSDGYVLIPRGHLWVTGDNLPYSRDSRTYGPVSMGLVRSRLFARVRLIDS
ncbi:LexA/Signal peptidase [Cylindrobasidium torrendii FP15055 ss-10]|uniref:LexA/Signal peptidase n=1 Tax=Cylindrobasidium torrendii FP15055 ss-10 TaxID=1314674 RepID=A0A0D7B0G7_9AGAR|nr:LexA/Signal peptidase [Cylindrobasidium torrendii FP15055 ss-10]